MPESPPGLTPGHDRLRLYCLDCFRYWHFGHRSDDDEGLLLGAKRTCRLSFGQASELSVPVDRELLEEIVELEGGRLPAFENSFDQGR
jgi:hypothetical protein